MLSSSRSQRWDESPFSGDHLSETGAVSSQSCDSARPCNHMRSPRLRRSITKAPPKRLLASAGAVIEYRNFVHVGCCTGSALLLALPGRRGASAFADTELRCAFRDLAHRVEHVRALRRELPDLGRSRVRWCQHVVWLPPGKLPTLG